MTRASWRTDAGHDTEGQATMHVKHVTRAAIGGTWLLAVVAMIASFDALTNGLRPWFGDSAFLTAVLADGFALTFSTWSTCFALTGRRAHFLTAVARLCVAVSVVTNGIGAYHSPVPGATQHGLLSAFLHAIPPLFLAIVEYGTGWYFLADHRARAAKERAVRVLSVQVAQSAAGGRISERRCRSALVAAVELDAVDITPLVGMIAPDAPQALRALAACAPITPDGASVRERTDARTARALPASDVRTDDVRARALPTGFAVQPRPVTQDDVRAACEQRPDLGATAVARELCGPHANEREVQRVRACVQRVRKAGGE